MRKMKFWSKRGGAIITEGNSNSRKKINVKKKVWKERKDERKWGVRPL